MHVKVCKHMLGIAQYQGTVAQLASLIQQPKTVNGVWNSLKAIVEKPYWTTYVGLAGNGLEGWHLQQWSYWASTFLLSVLHSLLALAQRLRDRSFMPFYSKYKLCRSWGDDVLLRLLQTLSSTDNETADNTLWLSGTQLPKGQLVV